MNLKKVLFSALMLTATGAAVAVTEPESNVLMGGVISGRVVDAEHQALPGATIMVEDLHTGVTSDVNGFYTLPNMKPGTYKVKVSYVGYSPKTYVIKLVGKNVERNIILSEGNELKEVVVNGAFYGQRKALQMQKENMGVTNVVSADQVGKFPDSNIGDALKRINGINVQYDQGEARFGQVRGTSADLTSVTVNGNRMPSAEGDTRNVQLDLIPADMIQTIEVNKVVTSDMDGDAIGEAKNVEVVIGTPIGDVLDFCGVKDDVSKILMGGPMMGTAVADPAFPVLKQNNALVAFGPAAAALPAPGPCIRCGNCINACPMGLSPVEIAGAYTKNDGEMLDKLMVDLCIGCGTCSYVCPAKRPVTQTMNLAKAVWQKNKNGGKK